MSVGGRRPEEPAGRAREQRRIAGRYRLESRLGRGGMGTVWRAHDELLGRPVAVKELHVDAGRPAGGDATVDTTLREAHAVARVHHPHIVCVHDVVEEDGVPYIVMELVEGASLAERIAERGPVDAHEAARIGLALLSALRAAHAIGVLHRDLKPANVLVEEATGRIVLTDFGVAQLAGATTLTESGMFVGSPEYTAPERMQGHRAGPAADLWSLGVLLCTAMTGSSPFHRDSLGGVLHAVVEAEIRPPAAAGALLPVVRGLLERDPARRTDGAEAERLLRSYLAGGPRAGPLRRPAARGGPTRRRPTTGPTTVRRTGGPVRGRAVRGAPAHRAARAGQGPGPLPREGAAPPVAPAAPGPPAAPGVPAVPGPRRAGAAGRAGGARPAPGQGGRPGPRPRRARPARAAARRHRAPGRRAPRRRPRRRPAPADPAPPAVGTRTPYGPPAGPPSAGPSPYGTPLYDSPSSGTPLYHSRPYGTPPETRSPAGPAAAPLVAALVAAVAVAVALGILLLSTR